MLCVSTGDEFFKGAPGGSGRPGNAGFKGVKGAVFILFVLNRVVDMLTEELTPLLYLQ